MKKVLRVFVGNQPYEGDLYLPPHPKALVIFVHGSGSGRTSSRNNFVAQYLEKNGFAGFVFDLSLPKEKEEPLVNIPAFAARLVTLTEELKNQAPLEHLPTVYFGSSTGAAIAMAAAGKRPGLLQGLICRGGRIDLSAEFASKIPCAVLLLVGEWDTAVMQVNQRVLPAFSGPKKLEIISGADHLFGNPGNLEEVATASKTWLNDLLHSAKKRSNTTLKIQNHV